MLRARGSRASAFLLSVAPVGVKALDVDDARTYSHKEVRFALAHWEEFVTLDEAGETAKELREALKHELESLPQGIACLCDRQQTVPETVGGAGGAGRWRTPSVTLTDVKRAIAALPLASLFRTKLYLMTTPTHDYRIRHLGERCDRNWYGEQNGVLGHLVYLNETQVYEMPRPEFEARHRRRMATTGFMQAARAQDSWDVRDGYRYVVEFLNLGEAEFLATWSEYMGAARDRQAA